jgi:hypothetical protein
MLRREEMTIAKTSALYLSINLNNNNNWAVAAAQ